MTWTPPWKSQPIGAPLPINACRPLTRHLPYPLKLTPTQCAPFPVGRGIGQGSYATVFEHSTDPDKVVKFTTDERDAQSAALLKGKSLKGAVRVYDVARLVNLGTGEDVYGIVSERLGPVGNKVERDAIDAIDGFIGRESYARKRAGNPIVPGKGFDLGPDFTDRAVLYCQNGGFYEGACDIVPDLVEAVEEVGRAGVFSVDLHSDNWGQKPDGTLAILDFGVSRIDPDQPRDVPDLAGMKRRRRRR